jgi:hypothetical protein
VSSIPSTDLPATDYRFAAPIVLRAVGALVAIAGLLVLVAGALVASFDLPVAVLTVTVAVAVVVLLVGVVLVARVATLVRFDDAGYRVRWLRGVGVTQARWKDVEDVVTATVSGHDCVVLRLRDGRSTSLPVNVLDVSPSAFVRDLSRRLDAGHGYRRLR